MASFQIFRVSTDTHVADAGDDIVDCYVNNIKPTVEKVILGDLFFSELLAKVIHIRKDHAKTNEELTLCNYTINRFWEIKKLLLLLFEKKYKGAYTPSVIDIFNDIPPVPENPYGFRSKWENRLIQHVSDAKEIAIKTLYKLHQVMKPELSETILLQIAYTYILDKNLYEIAAVVTKKN